MVSYLAGLFGAKSTPSSAGMDVDYSAATAAAPAVVVVAPAKPMTSANKRKRGDKLVTTKVGAVAVKKIGTEPAAGQRLGKPVIQQKDKEEFSAFLDQLPDIAAEAWNDSGMGCIVQ